MKFNQDYFTVTFSCLHLFFGGSIFFGWPALLVVLKDERQYSELCVSTSSASSATCPEQDVRLNLIFTIAFFCNGCANLFGIISDHIGPKLTNLLGMILVESGLVLLTFADSKTFDSFIPGTAGIALGGASIYYGNFHVTNLLTKRRTFLISGLSGIWIAGGVVLSAVQFAYFQLSISRKASFMVLTTIVGLLFIGEVLFLAPIKKFESGGHADIKPFWIEMKELKAKRYIELSTQTDEESLSNSPHPSSSISPHQASLKSQLFSLPYLCAMSYALSGCFFISWELGTAQLQLNKITNENVFYTAIFVFVSSFGLLIIPLYSYLIDRFGIGVFTIIAISLTFLWSVINLIQWLPIQIFNFVLFGFCRVCTGSVIGNFNRQTFGLDNYGTLTGILWMLSACMSQIQTPVVKFVLNKLDGNFLIPNLCVATLPLIGLFLPIYIFNSKRDQTKKSKSPQPQNETITNNNNNK